MVSKGYVSYMYVYLAWFPVISGTHNPINNETIGVVKSINEAENRPVFNSQ